MWFYRKGNGNLGARMGGIVNNQDSTFDICPKCKAEVEHVKFGNIILEHCPNCKGLFLDFNELKEKEVERCDMADSDSLRRDEKDLDRMQIACPKCKVKMSKKKVLFKKGLRLDVCPSCRGIWFDKGELTRYINKDKNHFRKNSRIPVQLTCVKCSTDFDRDAKKDSSRKCPRCGEWLTIKFPEDFFVPLIDKKLLLTYIVFFVIVILIFLYASYMLKSAGQAFLFSSTLGVAAAFVLARVIVYKAMLRGYISRIGGTVHIIEEQD